MIEKTKNRNKRSTDNVVTEYKIFLFGKKKVKHLVPLKMSKVWVI